MICHFCKSTIGLKRIKYLYIICYKCYVLYSCKQRVNSDIKTIVPFYLQSLFLHKLKERLKIEYTNQRVNNKEQIKVKINNFLRYRKIYLQKTEIINFLKSYKIQKGKYKKKSLYHILNNDIKYAKYFFKQLKGLKLNRFNKFVHESSSINIQYIIDLYEKDLLTLLF